MFATVNDVETLWRPLTEAEKKKAGALIPVVEELIAQSIRNEGYSVRSLDAWAFEHHVGVNAVKAVVVDVTVRALRQSTTGDAMSQESQTALGYTWQGTYAVPGGGISNAIMRSDLKRLGIHKQRIKAVEMYDSGYHGPAHGKDADRC